MSKPKNLFASEGDAVHAFIRASDGKIHSITDTPETNRKGALHGLGVADQMATNRIWTVLDAIRKHYRNPTEPVTILAGKDKLPWSPTVGAIVGFMYYQNLETRVDKTVLFARAIECDGTKRLRKLVQIQNKTF